MEKFLNQMAELFERNNGDIKPNDNFREYEEWDSLTSLSLMAMLNEEYDITIPRADFEKMTTLADLYDYIQEHK